MRHVHPNGYLMINMNSHPIEKLESLYPVPCTTNGIIPPGGKERSRRGYKMIKVGWTDFGLANRRKLGDQSRGTIYGGIHRNHRLTAQFSVNARATNSAKSLSPQNLPLFRRELVSHVRAPLT